MNKLEVNKELHIFVTNVEAEEDTYLKIWGQLDRNAVMRVESMTHALEEYCATQPGLAGVQLTNLRMNTLCCAKFENSGFCRVRILNIRPDAMVVLRLIDYGTIEVLPLQDIYLLENIRGADCLQSYPPLAYDFILMDVLPINMVWDKQLVESIKGSLWHNEYKITIHSVLRNERFIKLQYLNEDFGELLVKRHMALASTLQDMLSIQRKAHMPIYQHPNKRISSNSYTPMLTSQNVMANPLHCEGSNTFQQTVTSCCTTPQKHITQNVPAQEALVFKTRVLDVGSEHDVYVSFVEDGPHKFSVQVQSTSQILSALMQEINSRPVVPLQEPPLPGSVCMGRYTQDRVLCRAVVMSVLENKCKVYYVDFGHTEVLPYTDIFELPPQYTNPKVLSIRFTLSGVKELNVTGEMKILFRKIVSGKSLRLHVRPPEGPPLVQYGDLYDNGRNIKDILRQSSAPPAIPLALSVNAYKNPPALLKTTEELVYVSFVESCKKFFIQVDATAKLLESTMECLKEFCKTAPTLNLTQIKIGLPCAALYDSQWYRAQIIAINEEKVTVLYVDYGNEETINLSSIRVIHDDLIRRLPAQAIKCTLNGWELMQHHKDITIHFELLTLEKRFLMKVVEVRADGLLVDLYNSESMTNIKSTLLHMVTSSVPMDATSNQQLDENQYASKVSNIKTSPSDTGNKWQKKNQTDWHQTEEPSRMQEKPKSKTWKEEQNEEKRYDTKFDKNNAFRSDLRSDRFNRDDSQSNVRNPREKSNNKYEQNDSSGFTRGGRSPRGGKSRSSSGSYRPNHSSSSEKGFSDKDSDTSIRSSNKRGRGGSTRGGYPRRDAGFNDQSNRWNDKDNSGNGYRPGKSNSDFHHGLNKSRERRSQGYRITRNKTNTAGSFRTSSPEPGRKQSFSPNTSDFETAANIAVGDIRTCVTTTINSPSDFFVELQASSVPTQSLHCQLFGVRDSTTESDKNRFIDKTRSKCLEVEFVSETNGTYEVLLREIIEGQSTRMYINEDFAKDIDIMKAKEQTRNRRNAASNIKGNFAKPVQYDYASLYSKWTVQTMKMGSQRDVIVTWFTNPNNFFCQMLDKESEFRTMMNEIQRMYMGRQPITEGLQIGSPVIGIFSDDGALYRAEIVELNKPGGHLIQYIDFGNTAVVQREKIFPVETKLMQLPKQAVQCSLKNIVPVNGTTWSKVKAMEMDSCFHADKYICTFHDMETNKYLISLTDNGKDIADILVQKNLASFVQNKCDAIVEEPSNLKPSLPSNVQRVDITLLSGQTLRVQVSSVESTSKFYIQLPSAVETENIINSYMANKNSEVMQRLSTREMCPGTGCLIYTNGIWRRAVITGCSKSTVFHVKLIDTGENDEIPSDCVLALPGELSVMQNQAIECSLRSGQSKEAGTKLKDLVEGKEVIVHVEEVDNNRLITKLFDFSGKEINIGNEPQEKICPVCPMPILTSTHKVTVSYADHSASVWLQRSSEYNLEMTLSQALQEYYASRGTSLKPETNAICAAKSGDGNWYRGKIISTSEKAAWVNFIDYGNSEEIPSELIMTLDSQFYVPHQLAISVGLVATLNCSKDKQLVILQEYLSNRELTAVFYNKNNSWVAELLFEGHKISEKFREINSEMQEQSLSKEPADVQNLAQGCKYEIYVSHVDSPNQFWIQCIEETDELCKKQEQLQIEAPKFSVTDGILEEGTLCAAVYSIDNMWYRAQVLDADEDITTIRFIDYGNTDVINTKSGNIRHLPESWSEMKHYAVKCKLNVVPVDSEDWTETACRKFENLVNSGESSYVFILKNSSPKRVDLFINEKSVSETLVEEKCALMYHAEDDSTDEIIDLELDPHSAFVSHINSPNEFWVQEEKSVSDLETMSDRFIVADMFPKVDTIQDGMLCVAKYPEDLQWYRARVISHDTNSTQVIYIDYGNSAYSTEIRAIPEDLINVPALSRKCCLALPDGISDWSERAADEFIKLAAYGATIFLLDVLKEDDTSLVKLTLDGRNVAEILAEFCERCPSIPEERLPPLGEENSPNVIVSRVNSIEEFWIQTESELAELDTMAARLEQAENFSPLNTINIGSICAAKYVEDNLWYRGKIVSQTDSDVEIYYIDYGNTDFTTELRKLPEEIVNIPPLARRCRLQKPDNINVWPNEAFEKFLELANNESSMFQFEVLDSNDPSLIKLNLDGTSVSEILAAHCETTSDTKSDKVVNEEDKTNAENEDYTDNIKEVEGSSHLEVHDSNGQSNESDSHVMTKLEVVKENEDSPQDTECENHTTNSDISSVNINQYDQPSSPIKEVKKSSDLETCDHNDKSNESDSHLLTKSEVEKENEDSPQDAECENSTTNTDISTVNINQYESDSNLMTKLEVEKKNEDLPQNTEHENNITYSDISCPTPAIELTVDEIVQKMERNTDEEPYEQEVTETITDFDSQDVKSVEDINKSNDKTESNLEVVDNTKLSEIAEVEEVKVSVEVSFEETSGTKSNTTICQGDSIEKEESIVVESNDNLQKNDTEVTIAVNSPSENQECKIDNVIDSSSCTITAAEEKVEADVDNNVKNNQSESNTEITVSETLNADESNISHVSDNQIDEEECNVSSVSPDTMERTEEENISKDVESCDDVLNEVPENISDNLEKNSENLENDSQNSPKIESLNQSCELVTTLHKVDYVEQVSTECEKDKVESELSKLEADDIESSLKSTENDVKEIQCQKSNNTE